MTKKRTLAQVAAAKKKAVSFVRTVKQDDERADEIEEESLEDYAQRRGLQIIGNPGGGRSMAATKQQLWDALERMYTIADDASDVTSTRTDLANAVQSIHEVGNEFFADDDDDNGDDADDDDDDE